MRPTLQRPAALCLLAAGLLLSACPALAGPREDAIEAFLRAKALLDAGHHEQAVELFGEVAEAFGKIGDERLRANCWYNITLAYLTIGRFDEAADYCEKALEVFLRLGRQMEIAGCRRFLAAIGSARGEYARALEHLDEARAAFETLGLQADVASCHQNAGEALKGLGRYTEAAEAFATALRAYTELGLEANQAACHNGLAGIRVILGQYREAIEGFERCLGIYERLGLQRDLADTWSNMGAMYGDVGQYELALEHHAKALEVYKWLKLPRDEADTLYNYGVAYVGLGLLERALEFYAAAAKLYETLRLPKDLADCHRAMGWAYARLEEPDRAGEMYSAAMEVYERLGLPKERAVCAGSLGSLLVDAGRAQESLPQHELAAGLFEALGLDEELGAVQAGMGRAYRLLRRFDDSVARFEAASRLFRRVAGNLTSEGRRWIPEPMLAVEAGLGATYFHRDRDGDLYRAYTHYARAIRIVEYLRSRGATSTELKTSYFSRMSWVYDEMVVILLTMRDRGLAVAPAVLQDSEPDYWQDLGMETPDLWRGWTGFEEAMMCYADGSRARALQELLTNRQVALADDRTRSLHRRWTALVAQERGLERQQAAAAQVPEGAAEVSRRLEAVTRRREAAGRALFRTAWGRVVEPEAITPSQVESLLEPGEAFVQYTVVEGLLVATVLSRPADGSPATLRAYGVRTATTQERPLWGRGTELRQDRVAARLDELRRTAGALDGLPPGVPGIASPEALMREFGIAELVWLFRRPMVLSSMPGEGQRRAEDMQGQQLRVAAALYSLLLGPLEEQLEDEGVTGLILVPNGALCYLPPGALVARLPEDIDDSPGGRMYAHPDLQYALERWRLSVVPSVGMYAGMVAGVSRRGVAAPSDLLCVFADAVFSTQDSRAVPAAPEAGGDGGERDPGARRALDALARLAETVARGAGEQLARLANTRQEARAALAAFGAGEAAMIEEPGQVRFGDNIALLSLAAREPLLYTPDLADYGYLLFSTHGVIDPARPEFSFIALTSGQVAGVGTPDSSDDGRLMLPEAFGLQLNARMVTLSACRMAEGDYQAGEGILGLGAAMFISGAQAVTAGLWSVDDGKTAGLIGDYHGRMGQGAAPAEALRRAQLAILEQARDAWIQDPLSEQSRYADPFYWAPFVVMGRW